MKTNPSFQMDEERLNSFNKNVRQQILSVQNFPFDYIHEHFSILFRLTLSNALRRVVDIQLTTTKLMTLYDFTLETQTPSQIAIFKMKPMRGNALMIFPCRFVFTIIDIVFGGSGELEVKAEGRDFTTIENHIMKRVVNAALEDLQTAWKEEFALHIEYNRMEVNPQFIRVMHDDEPIMKISFEVDLGRAPIPMTFGIPLSMIIHFIQWRLFVQKCSFLKINQWRSYLDFMFFHKTALKKDSQKKSQSEKIFQEPLKSSPAKNDQQLPENSRLDVLLGIESEMLESYIRHEHPQVQAFILSYLPEEEKVSEIIHALPENLKADVMYRISCLNRIQLGIVHEINKVLAEDLLDSQPVEQRGGYAFSAKILNALDKNEAQTILKPIEQANRELAQELKKYMKAVTSSK